MSEGVPDLDKRLAEIDRSLRQIQADLLPEREARPSSVQPEPESAAAVVAPETPIEGTLPVDPDPEPKPEAEVRGPAPVPMSVPVPVPVPPVPEPPDVPASEPPDLPATEPPEVPATEPPLPRGRSGPLAALLQRSRRSGRELRPQPAPAEPSAPAPGSPAPAPEAAGPPEESPAPAPQAPRPPGAIAAPQPASPLEQVIALTELQARLLTSMRELLAGYQQVLTALPPPAGVGPSPAGEVTLSVGPFASLEAVRAFERALADLPEVREVRVRGYEGPDRALVEVQLSDPTS